MKCCCNYPTETRAVSVTVAGGVTTITLPSSLTLTAGALYNVILATPIPEGTDGTQIAITNGISTGTVMLGNGNYYRAYPLTSRSVLRVQFFDDPTHFQILNPRWRV